MKSRAKTTLRYLLRAPHPCALFRSCRERRVHRRRRDCSDDAATRGGGRRRGPAPAARRVRVRGDRSTLGDDADDAPAPPVPRAVDPTRRRLVALCAVARPRARGGGGDALAERGDGRGGRRLGAFRAVDAETRARVARLPRQTLAPHRRGAGGGPRHRDIDFARGARPRRIRPLAARASARRRGGRRARVRRAHHAGVAPGRGLALRNRGGRARRRGALPRRRACRAAPPRARRPPRAVRGRLSPRGGLGRRERREESAARTRGRRGRRGRRVAT